MKKKKRIILILIIVVLLFVIGSILYQTIYLDWVSKIQLEIKGEKELTLSLLEPYEEKGVNATFRGKDITDKVKTTGTVNNEKVGEYIITYNVTYKNKKEEVTRKIFIIDKDAPVISLQGSDTMIIYQNGNFTDPGAVAMDNYDGDITASITTSGSVDPATIGMYEIVYSVKDSSENEASIKRTIEVKERPSVPQGIAVLNYHFFYTSPEVCGESICLNTTKFEEQLKYLKDNGYKTLTMEEFRAWMYGEIELPAKSVLLTIDDGAMGTGLHNGNKLIPLLEKYEAHATLFLITGWWNIDNYRSKYLDVESHTFDMHTEGLCSGVTRGAKMLCLSNAEVLNDLKKSIDITGSKKAFCYPFYAYNNNAISLVKEAGFQLAFAGGGYKATRNSNKYAIPRYPIHSDITLQTFINYIS